MSDLQWTEMGLLLVHLYLHHLLNDISDGLEAGAAAICSPVSDVELTQLVNLI